MVFKRLSVKVLFVSSGKSGSVGHVVKNQGESLVKLGINIEYFTIKSGFLGYLKAIPCIRRIIKKGRYDLFHAHYNLSGIAASLAGCFPIVVSLMGSEAYMSDFIKIITRAFSKFRWTATIVKTKEMKALLNLEGAYVIPNGVNIDRFVPGDMADARRKLNLRPDKKIVLFVSGKNRPEKNLPLAKKAVASLEDSTVEFLHVSDAENSEIPVYMNAANILLLTSSREGSVNVIKEAMACNCPIVATNVGDVNAIIGNIKGCYLCTADSEEITLKLREALAFNGRTYGRERILGLKVDSVSIGLRIKGLYESVIR